MRVNAVGYCTLCGYTEQVSAVIDADGRAVMSLVRDHWCDPRNPHIAKPPESTTDRVYSVLPDGADDVPDESKGTR